MHMLKLPFSWSITVKLSQFNMVAHIGPNAFCPLISFSEVFLFQLKNQIPCQPFFLLQVCSGLLLLWIIQVCSGVPFETGKPSDPSLQWLLQWRDGTRQTQVVSKIQLPDSWSENCTSVIGRYESVSPEVTKLSQHGTAPAHTAHHLLKGSGSQHLRTTSVQDDFDYNT